jgi:hypothetical protein
MQSLINFFFGKLICLFKGHDQVVDTVMRCKDGHKEVFWRCTRCNANNYRG